jgi:type I restriction enzyme R subunit
MSNFQHYPSNFAHIMHTACEAEAHVQGNLDVYGFLLRKTLEEWVHFVYEREVQLRLPYDQTIYNLMKESDFVSTIGDADVLRMMHAIRQLGNKSVHSIGRSSITQAEAIHGLQLLHSISYYLMALYADELIHKPAFDEALIPASHKLQAQELQAQLHQLKEAAEKPQPLVKKSAAEQQHYTHNRATAQQEIQAPIDPNEALTRALLIDSLLEEAGWNMNARHVKEYEVKGMPNNAGKGFIDYVLWGDDGKPLAIVEAKRTARDYNSGKHQAELYARCLEQQFGYLPNIFLSNGYEMSFYDWHYPYRTVQGFYTKDELALNIQRRHSKKELSLIPIDEDITNRYYQIAAIRAVAERLEAKHRGALLVMATGTGKTRTAASLIDVMSKANWAKRILFLADRTALVTQAKNNLNDYLPNLPAVNLVQEKEDIGSRIVFSTYQTLINLIDVERNGEEKLYGVGHFDLIIFDEIHRSVYNKYKAIFHYFDGIKIGLTATPVDFAEKNTYELFGLNTGNPTYDYNLKLAIEDQYLVPYKSYTVNTKFQREGIKYAELSDAEKLEYEEKFGDPITGEIPDEIEESALDKWIYNAQTADAILDHLMTYGIRVDNGTKLGKTIIFAKKHDHAEFIRARFNVNYPEYKDQFLKVIDYQMEYRHDLLNDFKINYKYPQIACSVDMLDTGIDVPEVVNLVFLKPVKSKVKFWQMIGRGTRLCPNLFGEGQHKQDFLILDFCSNFNFFSENPNGVEPAKQKSLAERLFIIRLKLGQILVQEREPSLQVLGQTNITALHAQIKTLYQEKKDSFIVRPHLKELEHFQDLAHWTNLSTADTQNLIGHLAPLVFVSDTDVAALSFDFMMYDFMICNLEQSKKQQTFINKLGRISHQLSQKTTIPQVVQKMGTIRMLQQEEYFKDIDCVAIENIRVELRDLQRFILKKKCLLFTRVWMI